MRDAQEGRWRVLACCARLGVALDDLHPHDVPGHASVIAPRIAGDAERARIVLAVGPSGSGKSCLLRAVRAELATHRARVHAVRASTRDVLPGALHACPKTTLSCLAAAGLADATLLATPASRLSDGQRARLALARAMVALQRSRAAQRVLVIDELGSNLDTPTARSLARALNAWARRERVGVVAATVRDDLVAYLAPDIVVRTHLGASPVIESHGGERAEALAHLRIEPGSREDWQSLARFHYRPGDPATIVGVLRAVDIEREELAGVLVVSMPTLNALHRDLAWPDRYTRGCKRERARRINHELRCISRVVVDPRYRAAGVATSLVCAYLRNTLTAATEAIAAMGASCPFFERAGMTAYHTPPRPRDARLLDALVHAGVPEHLVADVGGLSHLLGRHPWLKREAVAWARKSRSTRGGITRHGDAACVQSLAQCIARHVSLAPVTYAHVVN
ncbi:MAG: AAA family ATPase [Phycisphaerales bacterium]|jgi:ABC-type nitrate/sulfonate/bicarbonate transport system ATPase subunit/GNAT superfamily N-acetyltransferase|nr:AAA family ATPase [Phycisphaerales bacterium]